MKQGKLRKISTRSELFNKANFKFDADIKEYKQVIKALNKERCNMLLNQDEGLALPQNMGRLIILGTKASVKKQYSVSTPGTRVFNLHSFGWIYRVFHKERIVLRYSELFKFRPNRQNIKMKIYDAVVNKGKSYIKQQHCVF